MKSRRNPKPPFFHRVSQGSTLALSLLSPFTSHAYPSLPLAISISYCLYAVAIVVVLMINLPFKTAVVLRRHAPFQWVQPPLFFSLFSSASFFKPASALLKTAQADLTVFPLRLKDIPVSPFPFVSAPLCPATFLTPTHPLSQRRPLRTT